MMKNREHFMLSFAFEYVLNHSVMSDSATPWTIAHQVPLSMEFSR